MFGQGARFPQVINSFHFATRYVLMFSVPSNCVLHVPKSQSKVVNFL